MEEKTNIEKIERLRKQAEKKVRQQYDLLSARVDNLEPDEVHNLLHELQVHQVELEMQNEQLREIQTDLELSNERYFSLYEFAPVGYMTLDERGVVQQTNLTAVSMLAQERVRIVGQPFFKLISGRTHEQAWYDCRHTLLKSGATQTCQIRMIRGKDGQSFWARIEMTVLHGSIEPPSLRVAISDITARKEAEEKVEAAAEHTRILLQELNHRVKNNLQVIISLIDMQRRQIDNEQADKALRETRDRVQAIARVHSQLYLDKHYQAVHFNHHLKELVEWLVTSYSTDRSIHLNLDLEEASLPLDVAVSVTLIVNEIITNCIKYAFPEPYEDGEISVVLRNNEGNVVLTISDNGVGLKDDMHNRSGDKLGMKLTKILTQQVGGELNVRSDRGTQFQLRIPNEK